MTLRSHGAVAVCLLGIATAGCLFSGCSAFSGSEPEPSSNGLGVSAIQFQDVAVPDGFLLKDDANESHSIEEQGFRYGHFEYTHNEARIDDACAHVRARMAQHAWKLIGDEKPDETTRRMKFARGRYSVEYSLNRQDSVTRMVVDYRTEVPTP